MNSTEWQKTANSYSKHCFWLLGIVHGICQYYYSWPLQWEFRNLMQFPVIRNSRWMMFLNKLFYLCSSQLRSHWKFIFANYGRSTQNLVWHTGRPYTREHDAATITWGAVSSHLWRWRGYRITKHATQAGPSSQCTYMRRTSGSMSWALRWTCFRTVWGLSSWRLTTIKWWTSIIKLLRGLKTRANGRRY